MDQQDDQDPRPAAQGSSDDPHPHLESYADPAPGNGVADTPARYGAPLPPPAPTPPPLPPGAPAWMTPTPAAPRRSRRRLVAAGIALAVVAVAGGAGFALGRLDHQGRPSAGGTPGASPGQGPNGQGFGQSPYGNTDPFGTTPFDGPGSSGGSPFDSGNGTPASGSQLTGLVRVASTLKYQGGLAAGTGMVLTSTGEVVTNHHVVQGSTKLRVTVMTTGKSYDATVVGTDAKDDVAVLQLQDASDLQTVTTDTDGVSVGDSVTAVGDAGGDSTTFTAAAGKIIAAGQHITTSSQDGRPGERLRGLLEISSDVISGDSGGATYDSQGEVVGMTTAASSGTRDVVGYAIPIAKVVRIAADLENGAQNARYDYGSPAFLGIGLGGPTSRVGLVYPGTPAARAGLTAGDTITRVGTTRVTTATQLRRAVTAYSPGDRVRLAWTDANGTTHIATVTLMAGPIA